jgi:hypothetical protein
MALAVNMYGEVRILGIDTNVSGISMFLIAIATNAR